MVDSPPLLDPPSRDQWLGCVDGPLDPGAASAWAVQPHCGAVVTFTGTARDHADDRSGVHLLEYEAYEEHVLPVLARVADHLRQRHPDLGRVVLWHRTGALRVTDVAVVVAVSTPHRDAAFEAARWAIDEVKATAPIWKREHFEGGTEWGRSDLRHGHGSTGPLDTPEPGHERAAEAATR
ncbi:MAG: molybdenum cofactor biosynthesis protein MoaE [Acidimicrobiia bacterium]|jgi:molybdopterin synthase catalytic subunit|nr:molybdenum cofactor biosynthesis protein MoaE [Acidimicrobiia bacterium]